MGLKGTGVNDDDIIIYLTLSQSLLEDRRSPLESIDLSAVTKADSINIGDPAIEALSVSFFIILRHPNEIITVW